MAQQEEEKISKLLKTIDNSIFVNREFSESGLDYESKFLFTSK